MVRFSDSHELTVMGEGSRRLLRDEMKEEDYADDDTTTGDSRKSEDSTSFSHFSPPRRRTRYVVPSLIALVAILISIVIGLGFRLRGRDYLPHGIASCPTSVRFDCGAHIPASEHVSDGKAEEGWTFDVDRDEKNYGLTHEQCEAAFPGLFNEIDMMVQRRRDMRQEGRYTKESLDRLDHRFTVRIMVYDKELFLTDVKDTWGGRMSASLESLNRALAAAPEPLPNVEFAANDADWVDPGQSYFVYTRKPDWNDTWLMPDFGFYCWPEPGIGTFPEVRRRMRAIDDSMSLQDKIPKLVWRGSAEMGADLGKESLRAKLLSVTKDKSWADVHDLNWKNEESMADNHIRIEDHCKYSMVIHTEGRSYSGRLKYLQNCRTLIFMHTLQWIQPFEYLLVKEGEKQNYVEVERDFSDLEEKVLYYLAHPEEAARIADNSVRTFRDRYVTPASTSCYWRRLIRGWAEVSDSPEFLTEEGEWRGVPFESALLMGKKLHWDPHR